MLTEERVIQAVCRVLETHSYKIVGTSSASQHGDDIVAQRAGERLVIEAKGAGSSKPATARYGQEFTGAQVFDHVAKAVLKALREVAKGTARPGVALPDNKHHRNEIRQVQAALEQAGIGVFWVDDDESVILDSPWTL